jgi:hypothetical protein
VGGFIEGPHETYASLGRVRIADTPVGTGKGVPEDLLFFHRHLDLAQEGEGAAGTPLWRVEDPLVVYRHAGGASASISRRVLLRCRLAALERRLLCHWSAFSIWGAGRDGRNVFRDLLPENRDKVTCFLDVDPAKVGSTVLCLETKRRVPVKHFSEAVPPIVLCVALGRTGGALETNVASLGAFYVSGDIYGVFTFGCRSANGSGHCVFQLNLYIRMLVSRSMWNAVCHGWLSRT